MRIHRQKARKNYTCTKCRVAIVPGDVYLWYKHRYRPKTRRCNRCYPRPSELTTSDKLAQLYGAQEGLEDLQGGGASRDDVVNVLTEAATTATDVGEEYNQSADNMEEHFSGSYQVDEIREKADACEVWAEQLESLASDLEAEDCPDLTEEEWDQVNEAASGLEI